MKNIVFSKEKYICGEILLILIGWYSLLILGNKLKVIDKRVTASIIFFLYLFHRYLHYTEQKMRFSVKDFFSTFPADLITFTEEIFNGKLHFFVQC